jgi:hypothetical protein
VRTLFGRTAIVAASTLLLCAVAPASQSATAPRVSLIGRAPALVVGQT